MKQLKSELTALDRKITSELAPKKEEQDGVENKPASTVEVNVTVVDAPSTSDDQKNGREIEFRMCLDLIACYNRYKKVYDHSRHGVFAD